MVVVVTTGSGGGGVAVLGGYVFTLPRDFSSILDQSAASGMSKSATLLYRSRTLRFALSSGALISRYLPSLRVTMRA